MPFYDAIKFAIGTATGKIRRLGWEPGTYVCRGFKNQCMGVVLAVTDTNGKVSYSPYCAKSEDILANDWCLIVGG